MHLQKPLAVCSASNLPEAPGCTSGYSRNGTYVAFRERFLKMGTDVAVDVFVIVAQWLGWRRQRHERSNDADN